MKKTEKNSYKKEFKYYSKISSKQLNINKALGKAANQIGFNAENLVEKSFSNEILPGNLLPYWFYKIFKATKEQDSKGIDFIVLTDIGKIFLQIKSSLRGKQKFLTNKTGRSIIGVVIVKYFQSFETIRVNIIREVEKIRRYLLDKRKD
jgi:hypothetical protein